MTIKWRIPLSEVFLPSWKNEGEWLCWSWWIDLLPVLENEPLSLRLSPSLLSRSSLFVWVAVLGLMSSETTVITLGLFSLLSSSYNSSLFGGEPVFDWGLCWSFSAFPSLFLWSCSSFLVNFPWSSPTCEIFLWLAWTTSLLFDSLCLTSLAVCCWLEPDFTVEADWLRLEADLLRLLLEVEGWLEILDGLPEELEVTLLALACDLWHIGLIIFNCMRLLHHICHMKYRGV